jgi:hypothetical protein
VSRIGYRLAAATLLAACVPGVPDEPTASGPHAAHHARDAGTVGALRLEQISASFAAGDIQVRVTPLEEAVLRIAAPDLAQRLRGLAAEHRGLGDSRGSLLLVTYSSRTPDQRFFPSELRFSIGGRRLDVLEIQAVTSGWGEERASQRGGEAGVYVLGEKLDPFASFQVSYGGVTSDAWRDVISRLITETARVGDVPPT